MASNSSSYLSVASVASASSFEEYSATYTCMTESRYIVDSLNIKFKVQAYRENLRIWVHHEHPHFKENNFTFIKGLKSYQNQLPIFNF